MNCVEFERILPEDRRTPEQQAHLNSCSACASLLADLDFISSQAKSLVALHEPSPAVWNALEAQLRREGLIREPQISAPTISEPRISEERIDFFRRWRAAWLVPVAAALALIAVLRLHRPADAGDNLPVAKQTVAPPNAGRTASVSTEDRQLLDTVAARPPAQRAKYTSELDDANAFIRDAEAAVKNDPNDIYRQQMLINAYEQKQMLYDLAVDNTSEQ